MFLICLIKQYSRNICHGHTTRNIHYFLCKYYKKSWYINVLYHRFPAASNMPGNWSHLGLRNLPFLQKVCLHGWPLTGPSLRLCLLFPFPTGLYGNRIISDLSVHMPCSLLWTLLRLWLNFLFLIPCLVAHNPEWAWMAKTVNLAALFTSSSVSSIP